MNFNLAEARKKRDEAIREVERGVHDHWMKAAKWAIVDVALRYSEFTTDEVWETGLPDARENRAMGAAIVAAARAKIIERTDRVKPGRRVVAHARPITVWRSKIRSAA